MRRVAGHGTKEPIAPARRFLPVAAVHQRVESERRVANPAVAVVPVAHSAERLGQRRGRRGDDAAGRSIGEGLEGDQRSHHGVAPGPYLRTAAGPLAPGSVRVGESRGGVRRGRGRKVGWIPAQDERHALAGPDRELRGRGEALAGSGDRRAKRHSIGARDGREHAVEPANPGHGLAVVEADDELHAHRNAAAQALDDPDDMRRLVSDRQEVRDAGGAFGGFPLGLEDQRFVAIPAPRRPLGALRREEPAPVAGVAEQPREARAGVEPRQAQPVDRAVQPDQGGGVRVA